MVTVKFYLKNPKEFKNTILVRIRDGRRFDFTSATNEIVNLCDWDANLGQCLTSIQEFKLGKMVGSRSAETKNRLKVNSDINLYLVNLKAEIENKYRLSDKASITKNWLQEVIYPERYLATEIKEPNLLEYSQIYLAEKKDEFQKGKIKQGVVKKTQSIIRILERFISKERLESPMLTEIDRNFQRAYSDYCIEVEGYQASYSNRTFKAVKTICFNASANGYKINEGIRHLKISLERKKFPTLSFDDLALIQNFTYDLPHLQNARDWLLIGAYSGQRCSDFLRFESSMIEMEMVDGIETSFICFSQQKTKKQLRLALHSKITQILKNNEGQFPRKISSQKFNEYIKDVARLANIDEPFEGGIHKTNGKGRVRKEFGVYPKHKLVTSHICRRSFCTNFYGLIPTDVLMLASGHTTEKQFREYIQDVDRQQAARFAKEINSINTINFK